MPLHLRAAVVSERMRRLATKTDLLSSSIMQMWQEALDAPLDVPPTWLHGDLHPRNAAIGESTLVRVARDSHRILETQDITGKTS